MRRTATGNFVRIYLHFNFSTKDRLPSIDQEAERIIGQVALTKAGELGCFVVAFNGTEDHLHLLVSIPATLSSSDFVKHVKGASAYAINKALPSTSARFEWQRGFAVLSVSPEAVKRIKTYIECQKVHHAQKLLIEDLEVDGETCEEA